MKVIGAVQRAIDILNLFDARTVELSVTEIAAALKLHKSTTAGLMYTLAANGYLEQNGRTRKYRLGLKFMEHAAALFERNEVSPAALPYLEALRDEVEDSVNLAVLDGFEVVYVARFLGKHALSIRTEVGKRAPAHSTALGKAILAQRPPAEVRALYKKKKLMALTPNTLTTLDRLLKDLAKTRLRGFALDDEENELGGRCVAAPIFDHQGCVVAALSISVPLARFPKAAINTLGQKAKDTAQTISRSLGYVAQR